MSDQAKSDAITGSTDSQQERGHGRRAVMLGAAAVGAGAVAGMAGSAGTAMASTEHAAAAPKGAVSPARSIVVRLPPTPFNIDQTFKILQSVLNQAGCGGCYSGWDISFVHETEFIVNVDGSVRPEV